MRLWIDTDVGDNPDDAVALLCAAAHPDVELVGVSTVDGDHERRARVARTLVDAPVHAGDDPALAASMAGGAPDALLAIGPLTNIATFIEVGATVPTLAVMGGLPRPIRYRGVQRRVDHNFGRDPAAAAQVLARRSGVLVVPLDVTVGMTLDDTGVARLLDAAPVLVPYVEAWTGERRDAGSPAEPRAVCLNDPLALLALIEPELVQVQRMGLAVEPDGRLVESDGAPIHRVVRGADVPRAMAMILGLLTRGVG